MKKVLVITPDCLPIPAIKGGAVETLLTSFIEENEKKHLFDLYVTSVKEGMPKKALIHYNYTHIKYLKSKGFIYKIFAVISARLNYHFHINLHFSSLYYIKVLLWGLKIQPDLVVAEGICADNAWLLSKKIGRERMVFHLHHEKPSDKGYKKTFANVIVVSNFIKNSWMQGDSVSPDYVYVVKNGIDLSEKKLSTNERMKMRDKLNLEKNDFCVLFCGRVVPVKGVKELAFAWQYIDAPHIKLVIVGGSNFADSKVTDYYEEVQNIARKDSRIQMCGYVNHEKLASYYSAADLVVVPSLCEEAAGLVAVEAMNFGCPLVVTKSGGIGEYVSPKCSIQIEKDGQISLNLAKAILRLAQDRNLYLHLKKNAENTAAQFSKENYYDCLSDVLNTIADNGKET